MLDRNRNHIERRKTTENLYHYPYYPYEANLTKNSKKQRIRDKAAELLNRVKTQNYIVHHHVVE